MHWDMGYVSTRRGQLTGRKFEILAQATPYESAIQPYSQTCQFRSGRRTACIEKGVSISDSFSNRCLMMLFSDWVNNGDEDASLGRTAKATTDRKTVKQPSMIKKYCQPWFNLSLNHRRTPLRGELLTFSVLFHWKTLHAINPLNAFATKPML